MVKQPKPIDVDDDLVVAHFVFQGVVYLLVKPALRVSVFRFAQIFFRGFKENVVSFLVKV